MFNKFCRRLYRAYMRPELPVERVLHSLGSCMRMDVQRPVLRHRSSQFSRSVGAEVQVFQFAKGFNNRNVIIFNKLSY